MRIRVLSVDPSPDTRLVTFESPVGCATAVWATSRDIPPVVGRSYDVELDIDGMVEKGKEATVLGSGAHAIAGAGDSVVIDCTVEAVDEDGVTFMRLTAGCLFMVETPGGLVPGELLRISVPARRFLVTVFGVSPGE
jgi:hypothetical protein